MVKKLGKTIENWSEELQECLDLQEMNAESLENSMVPTERLELPTH